MSNIGTEFEKDLSREFGINRVPGSGNQFHSKLDLYGNGARWSLKATENKSISISQDVIDEAVAACESLYGTGEMPVFAFRIGNENYDMIMVRKDDFKSLQTGDIKIIEVETNKKTEQRRARAKTPRLLREN